MWYEKNALIAEKSTIPSLIRNSRTYQYSKNSQKLNHINENSSSPEYAQTNAGMSF
jgi:hypothetical protein